MPKKTKEKSQDFGASPQKKRSRPFPLSSDDEEEDFQFLPPTRISENDPLFGNQTSRQVPKTVTQGPSMAVTDEEWEEMLRMTKKEIPGINVPSPFKKLTQVYYYSFCYRHAAGCSSRTSGRSPNLIYWLNLTFSLYVPFHIELVIFSTIILLLFEIWVQLNNIWGGKFQTFSNNFYEIKIRYEIVFPNNRKTLSSY